MELGSSRLPTILLPPANAYQRKLASANLFGLGLGLGQVWVWISGGSAKVSAFGRTCELFLPTCLIGDGWASLLLAHDGFSLETSLKSPFLHADSPLGSSEPVD